MLFQFKDADVATLMERGALLSVQGFWQGALGNTNSPLLTPAHNKQFLRQYMEKFRRSTSISDNKLPSCLPACQGVFALEVTLVYYVDD